MQPYQQASEQIQRQGEAPFNIAKKAGGFALGAAGGAAISRILPFLSPYIPENLAIKGLNKIDPRFGKFINKSMSNGQTFDEVKGFIKDKVEEEEEPEEERNIIQQYSPELHTFIDQEIKKGRTPVQAGALAQIDKKFKPVIDKISKDHKTDWSKILESIYGGGASSSTQQPGIQQQAQGDLVDPTKARGQFPNTGSVQAAQQGQTSAKWEQIANSLQNLLKS